MLDKVLVQGRVITNKSRCLGLKEAKHHTVDINAIRHYFLGQAAGKTDDPSFGSGIGYNPHRYGPHHRSGANIDDLSTALFQHDLQGLAGSAKFLGQMAGDTAVPFLIGDIDSGLFERLRSIPREKEEHRC